MKHFFRLLLRGLLLPALAFVPQAADSAATASPSASAATFVIERMAGGPVSAPPDSHAKLVPTGPQPAKGEVRPADGSGLLLRRLTDVSDSRSSVARAWDGNPANGWTNGYAKYPCVNITGEYALAFGSSPGMATLVRLSDCENLGGIITGFDNRAGIGEGSGARWDLSGREGTETHIWVDSIFGDYKHNRGGNWLTWINALTQRKGPPLRLMLEDERKPMVIEMVHHAGQSARYRVFNCGDLKLRIFDIQADRLLDFTLPAAAHDVSPSGEWLFHMGGRPNSFYRISDLAASRTENPVKLPTMSHGHDGWGWTRDGREVYLSMDNNNDWFFAFDPARNERINIFHMSEIGWGTNYHIAHMLNPDQKGWFLLSTYSHESPADTWAANQLMMVEIAPAAERPRVWRLASTYNDFLKSGKGNAYFTEAFASIDPQGSAVYWGANWMGTDNLELYRLELPENWHAQLDSRK